MPDPIITTELLKKIAKMPRLQREAYMRLVGDVEWKRCAEDPLYWLDASRHVVPYVYTIDPRSLYTCKACKTDVSYTFDKLEYHLLNTHQIEGLGTLELYNKFIELPRKRPFTIMPYMPPLIDIWLKKKLVAIEKSRDMMATWLYVALYTWDTYFHTGRENIFQSETGIKANELIERAFYLLNNQPKFIKDRMPFTYTAGQNKSGVLLVGGGKNHGGSEIFGIPQGADQMRMYHPSGLLSDESAFQFEAEAAFGALKPAIQAGGRCTMLSSANPSYFMRICRDTLDQ